ncbi:ankyrin repeat domain-containing protein 29-like [Haliotis rubra]|uniref:ankyrin repeat domain-containing protein 29-like n=1 Tax=Haliotis rubra TaxID=36100 RepID=UPI001EE50337|nr:ankyrin repeat domain-containing protein 29-like [Haliotis rubra]
MQSLDIQRQVFPYTVKKNVSQGDMETDVILTVLQTVIFVHRTPCTVTKKTDDAMKDAIRRKKGMDDAEVGQRLISATNLDDSRQEDNILHKACRKGTLAQVRQILSHELVDINSRGRCGWTPVRIAAEGGRRELVDLLVRQGCDLSLTDDDGNTVLHVASIKGHLKIVRYILSKKTVDVNITGHCNRTAVMAAARFGHRKVFDVLVRNGSNLSTVDSDANNILHIACIGGHVKIVKYILTNVQVDINSKGYNGMTPVMLASNFGHQSVFQLLIKKKCVLRIINENGMNILHVACAGNNVEIVKYILKENIASINSRDNTGKTPVMLAAECGHTDVFKLLLNNQCDTQVYEDGNTILHTSCALGHVDIVKCILTQGLIHIDSCGQNQMTPVMLAAKNGQRNTFDLLVNNKCDMKKCDTNGNTVLHMACMGGNEDIVQAVLSKKLVDINNRGQSQRTPAMVAAACGHKDVFDLIERSGADLTLTDCNGFGVLQLICMYGHLHLVEHLKKKIAVS